MTQYILYIFLITTIFNFAYAEGNSDKANSPKSFYQSLTKVTPVDILGIQAEWSIDQDLNQVTALAEVNFEVVESGYPMLMLNSHSTVLSGEREVKLVKVNDQINKGGNLFYVDSFFESGKKHVLKFKYKFNSFSHSSLEQDQRHSHFLPVRYYMNSFTEVGLPSNLQFDHYPLDLTINHTDDDLLRFYINGDLVKETSTVKKYVFPHFFTGASFYIDIVKLDEISEKKINLVSKVSNKVIPLIVYAEKDDSAYATIHAFAKVLELSFHALEQKFGPYPFNNIIFKPNNRLNKYSGGAFAGAMSLPDHYLEHMTHELGHSYFGHYFSPANGNDQWIYEGMGNWLPLLRKVSHFRDKNYSKFYNLDLGVYNIWKTFDAHGIGTSILQTIDAEVRSKSTSKNYQEGGLPAVFKALFSKHKPRTVSTQQLGQMLTEETGVDFEPLFSYYFLNY